MTSDDRLLMEQTPWVAALSAAARTDVLGAIQVRTYKQGDILHFEGDPAEGYYGVITGRLAASKMSKNGQHIIHAHLHTMQWFGEMSLLDASPRAHTITALTATRLAVIPRSVIERLMRQYPDVYQAVVKNLCSITRLVYEGINNLLQRSPKQWLATRMLEAAESLPASDVIDINQQELADLCGLSRQSVNAHLKNWEKCGLIKRKYGAITLLDKKRLQREAHEDSPHS